jgi:hypothetical protein
MAEITTTHGPMDEAQLEKRVGSLDNDNEHTEWTEYYLGNELVHRSVHVTLKQGIEHRIELGEFGG